MLDHVYWMKRALAYARKGVGFVNPNPMVGAIVVSKDGKYVSHGYHEKFGQAHAERLALDRAGGLARDSTLYITLEPCSHTGKTPPCLDAVLASKISTLVIASKDPNPIVSSLDQIKEAGIDVITGVLDQQNKKLNRIYFQKAQHECAFVMAKVAISRDGYMGHRQKRIHISDPLTQVRSMKLRAMVDGILVGSRTWKNDDPCLNVRGKYQDRKPARILLDRLLEIKFDARIFSHDGGQIYLVHDPDFSKPAQWMIDKKIVCLPIKSHQGQFRPQDILSKLDRLGIYSILLEGGNALFQSFADQGLISDWTLYQSEQNLEPSYAKEDLVAFGAFNAQGEPCQSLFSLDLQSAIRCGRDLVWTT